MMIMNKIKKMNEEKKLSVQLPPLPPLPPPVLFKINLRY